MVSENHKFVSQATYWTAMYQNMELTEDAGEKRKRIC